METVLDMHGDIADGERGELGTAERPHPAHDQLAVAVGLAWRTGKLTRRTGLALMACYPAFVVVAVTVR
ncbi:MAG: hypothetical protein M3Y89_14240 [Actinomycetota bacterium]|nr:hypothetical protein [Actinomycetota bacterium]